MKWNKEEIEILKKEYSRSDSKRMVELLPGRNRQGIKTKANQMGMKKENRSVFSEAEIEKLKELYAWHTNKEIAEIMGFSVDTINNKGSNLGLRKDIEFVRELARKNFTPDHPARKYWIKPGHVPINKGLKMEEYMTPDKIEICKRSMFKKGLVPHNAKPIGYERINKEGYVEVKTKEPRTFEFKHRLIYEQHFGKIPKGYNVNFKDGDRSNFDPSNLIAMDKGTQMVNNSIVRYPKEVRSAITVVHKLNRIIKKYETDKH